MLCIAMADERAYMQSFTIFLAIPHWITQTHTHRSNIYNYIIILSIICFGFFFRCMAICYHTLSSRRISHSTISIMMKFIIANNTILSIFYTLFLSKLSRVFTKNKESTMRTNKQIMWRKLFWNQLWFVSKSPPKTGFERCRLFIAACSHASFIPYQWRQFYLLTNIFVSSHPVCCWVFCITAIINLLNATIKLWCVQTVQCYNKRIQADTNTFLMAYAKRHCLWGRCFIKPINIERTDWIRYIAFTIYLILAIQCWINTYPQT